MNSMVTRTGRAVQNPPSLRGRPTRRFKQYQGQMQKPVLPNETMLKPVPPSFPNEMKLAPREPRVSPQGMLVTSKLVEQLTPASAPRPRTAPSNLQPAIEAAQQKIHMRFRQMHKAFQHVDLDKSGTLERSEIARMCDGWNINVLNVDELLRHCDTNGDGVLNYHEFVDAFAQDTVQRGTWYASDMQLRTAVTPEHVNPAAGVFGLKAPRRFGEPMRPINCAQGISGHLTDRALLFAVRERVKQRYTTPRKAFEHISNANGNISSREMAGAIAHWNLPVKSAQVSALVSRCDTSNDGVLSYQEFRKGFFA